MYSLLLIVVVRGSWTRPKSTIRLRSVRTRLLLLDVSKHLLTKPETTLRKEGGIINTKKERPAIRLYLFSRVFMA